MDAELVEIRDFLAGQVPFDQLDPEVLRSLPARLTVRYHRRGTRILLPGDRADEAYVLRSGAVDVHDGDGVLRNRREAGATFGAGLVLEGIARRHTATAREDCLVFVVPGEVMREVADGNAAFAEYFRDSQPSRLHSAVEAEHASEGGQPILRTRVSEIVRADVVSVAPTATIRESAETMSREGRSALLVMAGGAPVGIVTDKDLRNRVVATGRALTDPIASIMTEDPFTAPGDTMAFELLLELVTRNIHHAPIVRDGTVIGVVTSGDLLRLEHSNPLYLVGTIAKQRSADGLGEVARRLPDLVAQLVRQDASADDIGRVVTGVGDAIERRLLELAEADLGAPPVPYCWVVLGSQARLEQGLSSDQDNAMIISDEMRPGDEPYFAELARRVSDGLAACGYSYCQGDVMATNDRWRTTQTTWRRTFERWLRQPDPDAVLRSSIFFDMRALHGQIELMDGVRDRVLTATPAATVFLAHMAKQAVARRPPIGFFREFVLEPEGEHTDTLDLKRGGVGAVVDLARVYALTIGSAAVNTQARLVALADAGKIGADQAADLRDALEFISYVRLRHQGRQVRAGKVADNFVSPSELSGVERRHLRDVFQVVRKAQSALANQFPLQYIS